MKDCHVFELDHPEREQERDAEKEGRNVNRIDDFDELLGSTIDSFRCPPKSNLV